MVFLVLWLPAGLGQASTSLYREIRGWDESEVRVLTPPPLAWVLLAWVILWSSWVHLTQATASVGQPSPAAATAALSKLGNLSPPLDLGLELPSAGLNPWCFALLCCFPLTLSILCGSPFLSSPPDTLTDSAICFLWGLTMLVPDAHLGPIMVLGRSLKSYQCIRNRCFYLAESYLLLIRTLHWRQKGNPGPLDGRPQKLTQLVSIRAAICDLMNGSPYTEKGGWLSCISESSLVQGLVHTASLSFHCTCCIPPPHCTAVPSQHQPFVPH